MDSSRRVDLVRGASIATVAAGLSAVTAGAAIHGNVTFLSWLYRAIGEKLGALSPGVLVTLGLVAMAAPYVFLFAVAATHADEALPWAGAIALGGIALGCMMVAHGLQTAQAGTPIQRAAVLSGTRIVVPPGLAQGCAAARVPQSWRPAKVLASAQCAEGDAAAATFVKFADNIAMNRAWFAKIRSSRTDPALTIYDEGSWGPHGAPPDAGRYLAFTGDGSAIVVWSDSRTHTLAWLQSSREGVAALTQRWSAAVG